MEKGPKGCVPVEARSVLNAFSQTGPARKILGSITRFLVRIAVESTLPHDFKELVSSLEAGLIPLYLTKKLRYLHTSNGGP